MKKILTLILITLIFSCQTDKSKQMNEERKLIIENYIKAYNGFDIDGMVKDLDKAVVFENVTNGEVDLTTNGVEEFRKQAESATAYFREREQSVQSWDFKENEIIVDIAYKAILAIELPNGMKPGDTLELKGQSVFTFKDGKVVKIQDRS
ncbi:MAG: nuclear transport factor 2 family protein [Bacteroidota bacterium]